MTDPTDAALVDAARSGDTDAFGQIYERYSARVYGLCMTILRGPADAADATQDTFIRAAERLHQLRSPARLRSWLFSIARNEALQRIRKSSRLEPLDEDEDDDGPGVPLAVEGAEVEAVQAVADDELRDLVWAASEGLEDRDRAVLDLYVRQGLEGEELGEAMGVSTEYAYQLTRRVRTRIERALGALLVARLGRDDCPELQRVLAGWDGTYDPTVRRRVVRHVDGCDVCQANRGALTSPVALFATVPLLPVPLAIKGDVLAAVTAGGLLGGGAGAAAAAGVTGGAAAGGTSSGPSPVRVGAIVAAVLIAGALSLLAWYASRDGGGDIATDAAGSAPLEVTPTAGSPTTPLTVPPTTAPGAATPPTATPPTASVTTGPPATAPSTTASVTTVPPATVPPATVPPATVPATTLPPTTVPPATVPATTLPPTTVPPPPTTTPAPPPERIDMTPGLADIGTGTSATLTLSNRGGAPASYTVSGVPPGVSVRPASGTVAAGGVVELTVAVDRAASGGPVDAVMQLDVGALSLPVAVTAS